MPIQCEYYALEGLGQLLRNVDLVKRNLNPTLEVSTIVCVMYDARTKLADQVVSEVREHFGDKVCRTVVPRTVRLSEAPSFGQPIITFDSVVARRRRVSGVGQGGQSWRGSADWVRGLGALIPAGDVAEDDADGAPRLEDLPIESIAPNPHQPRVHFDEESLAELAASIREIGVLQPVLVRPIDGGYELLAGERRWRAARRAGLARHPGDHPRHRRARLRRAGAGREPPSPGPHPARGGRRLSTADRGLRADPRAGRRAASARAARRSPTRCG